MKHINVLGLARLSNKIFHGLQNIIIKYLNLVSAQTKFPALIINKLSKLI